MRARHRVRLLVNLANGSTLAGASWALCGDFGAWNVFERLAGLADGGYARKPLYRPLTCRVFQHMRQARG